MNDRELLEFAAKAAGMPPPVDSNGVWSAWSGTMDNGHWWDPLADDGDALRLAVKLQIQLVPGTYNKDEFCAYAPDGRMAKEYWSSLQDERTATRRVIVRAAAAIGEAMP